MKDLNEIGIVKPFLAYKLIDILAKPFRKWPAYKLGIIDEKGKVLKKTLQSRQEKRAYGIFEKIIRKMKVIMNKFIGPMKIAAILATIYLIKDDVTIDHLLKYLQRIDEDFRNYKGETMKVETLFENILLEGNDIIKKGTYKFIIDDPDDEFKEGDKFTLKQDLKADKKVAGMNIYTVNIKGTKIRFAFSMIKKA